MEQEIIKRLLETNERAQKSSDRKFFIAMFVLILSICGNIYQATVGTQIVIESKSSFEQSDNNINEVKGK